MSTKDNYLFICCWKISEKNNDCFCDFVFYPIIDESVNKVKSTCESNGCKGNNYGKF